MTDTGKSELPHYQWPYHLNLPSGAGTAIVWLPSHATLGDLKWLAGEVSKGLVTEIGLPSGEGDAKIRWPSDPTAADRKWLAAQIYTDPDSRLSLIKKP